MDSEPVDVRLVVDVANVMGARPDGWWRDRAGAAARLVQSLAALLGTITTDPSGRQVRLGPVLAVVEGQARAIAEPAAPDRVALVRAAADGDTSVVLTCADLLAAGEQPLAVTADRGLRERLPAGTVVAGPRWLLGLLGRDGQSR